MFMRFASATIVTTWLLQSLTANFLSAANPTFQVQPAPAAEGVTLPSVATTPSDLLKQSLEIAKQGDVQGGFAKAKDAKQLAQQQSQFGSMLVIEYLNTLVDLLELTSADQKVSLRSEAVATIDQFMAQPDFDGKGNPQISYFFMTAVKRFADLIVSDDQPLYVRLQIQQGSIANSLKQNPNYPVDGKPFLAESLASMAIGLALNKEPDQAKNTLSEAFSLGFCEFEDFRKQPVLNEVQDRKILDDHLAELQQQYLASLKDWSSREITQFQSFRFNFHVNSTRGGSLSSRDHVGQVTVIDLWATWCAPCRETLPHFDQLHKNYRKLGVKVVGISMDSPENPDQSLEKVREFMTNHKFRFPCGMGTLDLKQQLPADIKLPTTLFVDRSGTVRYMTNGYQDYAKLEAITATLLNEKQPVMANNPSLGESH